MIESYTKLVSKLRGALAHDPFWREKLSPKATFAVHLAILREPYLTFIMEGKKTIETRFAKRKCAPFEKVSDGDVLLLKAAGGKIVGTCLVEKTWFYHLDPKSLAFIKDKFGKAICPAGPSFWSERREASVATLMLIKKVTTISNIHIDKRDRRGWVVFEAREKELDLWA